jgi:hypothetical protein
MGSNPFGDDHLHRRSEAHFPRREAIVAICALAGMRLARSDLKNTIRSNDLQKAQLLPNSPGPTTASRYRPAAASGAGRQTRRSVAVGSGLNEKVTPCARTAGVGPWW